jgi:cytochrome c oxidase subunit I+III
LVAWTVLHIAIGVVMLVYCWLSRVRGRMTSEHDIDLHNVVLYWHFLILTVVLTALVIGGFPLVA